MSTNMVELIKMIDFGDIDGLYDANLESYFIDDNYWQTIVENNVYFVIGRKGTGKSAIYNWIEKQAGNNDAIISNMSFKDFPFEKLLTLKDEDFSRPNQFQSIWRNIIFLELAAQITRDANSVVNDEYKQLFNYIHYLFGDDVIDLHKQVVTKADKTSGSISLKPLSLSAESIGNTTYAREFSNMTQINRRLENVIINYFQDYPETTKFLIQFDQLDDNYTQYQNMGEYHQAIISLFKVIYDINQTFKSRNIKAKVVGYLRSDIYNSIDQFDAESARWDRYKLNLNWSIVNRDDWANARLLRMINKRINLSIPSISENGAFNALFSKKVFDFDSRESIFKFVVHRGFHRPRDVLQFSIKIQDEIIRTNSISRSTIPSAEKEYSLWLLSEISNEIAVKINDQDILHELLRIVGPQPFSLTEFKQQRYKSFEAKLGMDAESLLRYLYQFGIVLNRNRLKTHTEYYSIMRNDRSTLNRELKIQIHPGIWKGLHTSTYSLRR